MYRNIISIVKGGPAPEEQLPVLRQAGWDGVFFPWRGTERDGALAAAVVRQGLALQSVHAPYDGAEKLWTEDGAAETERLIRCIREVASYGCGLVVMHAIVGMQHIAPTERERAYGFENFSAVYEAAREAGVIVAMENTEGEGYLDALLTHFAAHPNVRFCIDTGHEMCYDRCHDLIGRYAPLLYCTHLNDNLGMSGDTITWEDDLHLLPFDGAADWGKIVSRLKAAGYKGDFTYEVKLEGREGRHEHDGYRALSFAEYAALALARAQRIRTMFFGGEA